MPSSPNSAACQRAKERLLHTLESGADIRQVVAAARVYLDAVSCNAGVVHNRLKSLADGWGTLTAEDSSLYSVALDCNFLQSAQPPGDLALCIHAGLDILGGYVDRITANEGPPVLSHSDLDEIIKLVDLVINSDATDPERQWLGVDKWQSVRQLKEEAEKARDRVSAAGIEGAHYLLHPEGLELLESCDDDAKLPTDLAHSMRRAIAECSSQFEFDAAYLSEVDERLAELFTLTQASADIGAVVRAVRKFIDDFSDPSDGRTLFLEHFINGVCVDVRDDDGIVDDRTEEKLAAACVALSRAKRDGLTEWRMADLRKAIGDYLDRRGLLSKEAELATPTGPAGEAAGQVSSGDEHSEGGRESTNESDVIPVRKSDVDLSESERKVSVGGATLEFGGDRVLWDLFVTILSRNGARYPTDDLILDFRSDDDVPIESGTFYGYIHDLNARLSRIGIKAAAERKLGYRLEFV